MTQPDIPARDADSSRDVDAASAPSYPQRSTAQDHSATQELPVAQDATREMPSASEIPAPPAGAVPPASAQHAEKQIRKHIKRPSEKGSDGLRSILESPFTFAIGFLRIISNSSWSFIRTF